MTQDEALDIMKMGHSVFLTGAAGTGKTFVLNKYIEYLKSHSHRFYSYLRADYTFLERNWNLGQA
jgi:Cdc6-like AAA superfamily ATPase